MKIPLLLFSTLLEQSWWRKIWTKQNKTNFLNPYVTTVNLHAVRDHTPAAPLYYIYLLPPTPPAATIWNCHSSNLHSISYVSYTIITRIWALDQSENMTTVSPLSD